MKRFYIVLFLIFLIGCTMQQQQEKPTETKEPNISETTDISDIGAMDEELDAKALETLEEDLEYIANI